MTGRDLPAGAVERAIAMSHEKYCSASIMLGKTAADHHQLRGGTGLTLPVKGLERGAGSDVVGGGGHDLGRGSHQRLGGRRQLDRARLQRLRRVRRFVVLHLGDDGA